MPLVYADTSALFAFFRAKGIEEFWTCDEEQSKAVKVAGLKLRLLVPRCFQWNNDGAGILMEIFRERRKDAAFHATRQRGKKCCGSVAGLLLFLLPLISLMVNRVAGVAPFSRSYIIPSFGQASANPGFQMGCPAATADELPHSTENGEEPACLPFEFHIRGRRKGQIASFPLKLSDGFSLRKLRVAPRFC